MPEIKRLRIAQLIVDNREAFGEYHKSEPWFGRAPEALLQGFSLMPDEVEVHVVTCAKKSMHSPLQIAPNIFFSSHRVSSIGWLKTCYQGCIRAARAALRKVAPDLVHGQGTERECALSAILSGFPSLITIHGNMDELARLSRAKPLTYAWFAARLENFALPRSRGVLCNSAYTESLVRRRQKTVWRVSNPIRLEYFSDRSDRSIGQTPRLICVGVVCPRKRQVEILRALRLLHERGNRFEIHFVGQAPGTAYSHEFLSLIRSPVYCDFARYHQFMEVKELVHKMDSCDAMVHFPSEEAFGLVVPEAIARGLTFFGASVGGICDIADGIESALLIEPTDWNGLVQHLEAWLRHPAHASESARDKVRARYHPTAIARKHIEIYRKVLGHDRLL
jgi:glycosyltransferase involved in cell wall biosynthesis